MKTVRFTKGNRSGDVLHVETDGCVVNIHIGLHDSQGRQVTAVAITPDGERRGGDAEGRTWRLAGDGRRVIRQEAPGDQASPDETPGEGEPGGAPQGAGG